MRKTIIVFVILSVFVTACTPQMLVNDFKSKAKYYAKVTSNCKGQKVNIVTVSGTTFSGLNLVVGVESTSWLDGETKIMTRTIPTREVLKIVRDEHNAGAVQGLFFGMAGGAVTGALLASRSDEKLIGLGAFVIGALGGLVGLLYGSISGAPIVYEIN